MKFSTLFIATAAIATTVEAQNSTTNGTTPNNVYVPPNMVVSKPCTQAYVDNLLYGTDLDDFVSTYNSDDPTVKYPSCNWNLQICKNFPKNARAWSDDLVDACHRLDFARRNTAIQGRYDSSKAAFHQQFQKDMSYICENRFTEPQESLCEGAAYEVFRQVDYIGVSPFVEAEYNADSPARTQVPFARTTVRS